VKLETTRHTTASQMRRARPLVVVAAVMSVLLGGIALAPSSSADPDAVRAADERLQELQNEAEGARERLNGAEIELQQVEKALQRGERRVARAKEDLAATQDLIGKIASTTYRSGGLDATLQLLLAESPEAFLNEAATLDQVAIGQAAALRRTQAARLRLAQAVAEIEQQKKAQADIVARMELEKAAIDASVAEQANVLAGLQAEERARLAEIQAQRAAEAAKRAEEARRAAEERAEAERERQQAEQDAQNNGGGSNSGGGGGGSSSGGGSNYNSDIGQIVVDAALAQLGEPYTYNAQPPNTWDCSKLTSYAWAQVGVYLTPYSYAQANEVRRIPYSEARPGDILFFFNGAHHTGIYLGGGLMLHAANPQSDVTISDLGGAWYQRTFSFAGRPYG
jgi:cell wall-associated NlpC family hydrolase